MATIKKHITATGKARWHVRVRRLGQPGRTRWLTSQQRKALLAACDQSGNPDLGLVVRIALTSGGRFAEITGLRWSWIDMAQECAFLPTTKNGEPRVLPLPGDIAALLRERGRVRRLDSDLVFPSPENPKRPRNMSQAWAVARKRAGLDGWRFHDCRHDAATAMLRAGVDSRVVATVLGHRSMNMLRRYAHVAPSSVVFQIAAAVRRAETPRRALHARFEPVCVLAAMVVGQTWQGAILSRRRLVR